MKQKERRKIAIDIIIHAIDNACIQKLNSIDNQDSEQLQIYFELCRLSRKSCLCIKAFTGYESL